MEKNFHIWESQMCRLNNNRNINIEKIDNINFFLKKNLRGRCNFDTKEVKELELRNTNRDWQFFNSVWNLQMNKLLLNIYEEWDIGSVNPIMYTCCKNPPKQVLKNKKKVVKNPILTNNMLAALGAVEKEKMKWDSWHISNL